MKIKFKKKSLQHTGNCMFGRMTKLQWVTPLRCSLAQCGNKNEEHQEENKFREQNELHYEAIIQVS